MIRAGRMIGIRGVGSTDPMPEVVEPSGPTWPPAPGASVVVLAEAGSSIERALLQRWAERLEGQGAKVTVEHDTAGAVAAAEAADAVIVPARVIWLGPAHDTATDRPAAAGFRPSWAQRVQPLRRGPLRTYGQSRVLTHRPGCVRILVGEPARLSEMTARWAERTATAVDAATAGRSDFRDFVARQADIVLERAERGVRGDRFRAPRAIVEEVLTSRGFVTEAEALATRLGRTTEGVLADCRVYLEEMASEERRLAIDTWAGWSRLLHSRAYDMQVDEDQLARLRELSAEHPLVFLPSHRSNLDPYVMTTVTYDNGLPHNHILGGINMAFWPLGPMARRVGAVFIRRSFRGNDVYRFTLSRYLGFLTAKRFNLEWYMEGGRSRTGKLLPPRLGLLNYLADAAEEMNLRDVLLVPTSIVYDILHEVGEMTSESRGAAKQAEGPRWLLNYARSQRSKHLGSVHVNFGEPVNLVDALQAAGASREPSDPDHRSRNKLARSKVAFEVCTRINRSTVTTAPALVSFALLGVGDRALTLDEVAEVLAPIQAYMDARSIPTDCATRELSSSAGLRHTLDAMVTHGVVERYSGGPETVYRVGPEQELVAAFYRNATIHWFVVRAIVELALLRAEAVDDDADALSVAWDEGFRLRDLLKFEFFFTDKEEFRAELVDELTIIEPDRDKWSALHEIGPALRASGALVAQRVLRSFLEAYSVVADRLVALGDRPAEPEQVVRDCLGLGQQYRLQRRVNSSEAVSSHLFHTGLQLAGNRDLLQGGADLAQRRASFAAELRDVLDSLEDINRLQNRVAAESAAAARIER